MLLMVDGRKPKLCHNIIADSVAGYGGSMAMATVIKNNIYKKYSKKTAEWTEMNHLIEVKKRT